MDAGTQNLVISQIQRELDAEVIYQNRKLQMGRLAQLKQKIGNIPGIETLAVHFGDGQQHITLNDQSITIGANAPDDEVLKALNLQKIDQIAAEPAKSEKPMSGSSVTGLGGGIIEAAVAKAKERLVAKVNEGVAKVESATAAGESKIDGVTSNLAAKIEKEIEDQVGAFVTLTNGGPV